MTAEAIGGRAVFEVGKNTIRHEGRSIVPYRVVGNCQELSDFVQCLGKILNDVLWVFDSDGESDEFWCETSRSLLFLGEL